MDDVRAPEVPHLVRRRARWTHPPALPSAPPRASQASPSGPVAEGGPSSRVAALLAHTGAVVGAIGARLDAEGACAVGDLDRADRLEASRVAHEAEAARTLAVLHRRDVTDA